VAARASHRHGGAVATPDRPTTGSSATADAFGASVSVPVSGNSLFFVVGRTAAPDTVVASVGGSVVTHLPDPRRALAIAPLEALESLRRHPELALAGPVSIDPERFSAFARIIGLDDAPASGRPP
jgi:hypothetical protein